MSDIIEAAASGDSREILLALRANIAERIASDPSDRDFTALSNRLLQVNDRLTTLSVEQGGDDISRAAKTKDEKWPASRG